MSPVRLKRISAGLYTAHGFTVVRTALRCNGRPVWALTWPDGGTDACESLRHARDTITHELWKETAR